MDGRILPVQHYHSWIEIRGVFAVSVSSNRTDGIILLKVWVSEMLISHTSSHRHELVNAQGPILKVVMKGRMKPRRLFLEWLTSFLHSIAILEPSKWLLKSRKNMLQDRRCLLVVKDVEGTTKFCVSTSGSATTVVVRP